MDLFVVVLAALGLSAAHGAWRVRVAVRRTDVRHEPATMLPRRLADLHYDLLRARTGLRAAIGLPIGPSVDLRPDGMPVAMSEWSDPLAAAVARADLARLWQVHRDVLGSPGDPVWHLHGRVDRMRVGPLGLQVVTLRATLGHDPARWFGIRAVRRSRGGLAGLTGLAGGGFRFHVRRRAMDPTQLMRSIGRDLTLDTGFPWRSPRGPMAVSSPSFRRRAEGLPPNGRRAVAALRRVGCARWELVAIEVLGSDGTNPSRSFGSAPRRAHRPPRRPALNRSDQRPDVPGEKR